MDKDRSNPRDFNVLVVKVGCERSICFGNSLVPQKVSSFDLLLSAVSILRIISQHPSLTWFKKKQILVLHQFLSLLWLLHQRVRYSLKWSCKSFWRLLKEADFLKVNSKKNYRHKNFHKGFCNLFFITRLPMSTINYHFVKQFKYIYLYLYS